MVIFMQGIRVTQAYLGEKIYRSIYYIYCFSYYILLLLEIGRLQAGYSSHTKHILEKRFINQYNIIYYIYFFGC